MVIRQSRWTQARTNCTFRVLLGRRCTAHVIESNIDNQKAAVLHIKTDDMERAMQCFNTDTFKEATRLVKITGHTLFLAQPRA